MSENIIEIEEIDPRIIELENRIRELKIQLRLSDYKALKYAEGAMSLTEFSEVKKQRQAWREEINALELEIAVIKSME